LQKGALQKELFHCRCNLAKGALAKGSLVKGILNTDIPLLQDSLNQPASEKKLLKFKESCLGDFAQVIFKHL
jgi:hypothetical protein